MGTGKKGWVVLLHPLHPLLRLSSNHVSAELRLLTRQDPNVT